MDTRQDRAIARCPTKQPLTRDEALTAAPRLGFPVMPYKCPNGWDHWHIGKSWKRAAMFYKDRERWESVWINRPDTIPRGPGWHE